MGDEPIENAPRLGDDLGANALAGEDDDSLRVRHGSFLFVMRAAPPTPTHPLKGEGDIESTRNFPLPR